MNRILGFIIICFALTCFSPTAWSANYYVLYDATCMDRLLYANSENGATSEYLVYRINANANERIFLEIGSENQRVQEVLPTQVYTCGSNFFTSKLAQNVNSGTDQVFLVIRKNNQQYTLSKVSTASYYQLVNNRIQYQSPRYNFELDSQKGIIGENITTMRRTELYFEGKLENDCTGAYIFTQKMRDEVRPYSDLVFVPEIGITEIRNGKDATDALNHTLRLEKVNNYPVTDYLRLLCKRTQPAATNQLTERGGVIQEYDVTPRTPYYNDNTKLPTNTNTATTPIRSANNPCGIEAVNGYHVVSKGETLYRISKMYSVTVAQIQAWNNLGNSTNIGSCDRLRVAPQTGGSGTIVNQPRQNQQFPYVVDNRPAVTQPAPYESTLLPKGTQQYMDNTTAAWKANQDYHVVTPGETVASIALKYGFTEARLRDLNGLSRTDVVRIGQPLKVNDCPPSRVATGSPSEYGTTGLSGEFRNKSPYDFNNDTRISPQFYQSSQTELPRSTSGAVSPELARRMNPTSTGTDNTTPQLYDANVGFRAQRAVHLVKEGENLYQIARVYGVSVERLRQLNNLNQSDVIMPFQRIYVN